MNVLGPDNAIYVGNGEWVGWDSIIDPEEVKSSRLAELEREAELKRKHPNANPMLVPYYLDLIVLAESYFHETGNHLNAYGDIGELFGAVFYGIHLHKNYAKGSDGRLGDDFVEIKTISPMKSAAKVTVRMDRHFSKLLVVKIDANFDVAGKLIDRKQLPKSTKIERNVSWANIE